MIRIEFRPRSIDPFIPIKAEILPDPPEVTAFVNMVKEARSKSKLNVIKYRRIK